MQPNPRASASFSRKAASLRSSSPADLTHYGVPCFPFLSHKLFSVNSKWFLFLCVFDSVGQCFGPNPELERRVYHEGLWTFQKHEPWALSRLRAESQSLTTLAIAPLWHLSWLFFPYFFFCNLQFIPTFPNSFCLKKKCASETKRFANLKSFSYFQSWSLYLSF